MSINPIYNKWKKSNSNDDAFIKKMLLFGLNKTDSEINKAFANQLKFVGNKIISPIGVGTSVINEYTITALANSFISSIKKISKKNNKKSIVIAAENTFHSTLYSNIFSKIFNDSGYQTVMFEKPESIPLCFKNLAAKNNDALAIVSLQRYNNLKNIIQISFNWGNGKPFSSSDVASLSWKLNMVNYLTINIPEYGINVKYDYSYREYQNFLTEEYRKYLPKFKKTKISFGLDFSRASSINYYNDIYKRLQFPVSIIQRNKNQYWYNANNQKHFKRIYWESLFRKYDANFIFSEDGSGINISIKHHKIYKYFKPDEIAALYLDYLLENDERIKEIGFDNFFIVKDVLTGSLTKSIALKHNIQVEEITQRSQTWNICENITKKELLLAFTNNNEFCSYKRAFNGFEAIQFSLELMKMINFYKEQNLTLFDKLNEIYQKYGKYHMTIKSYDTTEEGANEFIKRLILVDKIGNYKITNKTEIDKNSIISNNAILKLNFSGQDNAIVKYKRVENKIEIALETLNTKQDEESKLSTLIKEQEIFDGFQDMQEVKTVKKNNYWSIFKYSSFVAIFLLTVFFLFKSVFNFKSGGGFTASYNVLEIFQQTNSIIRLNWQTKVIFIFLVANFLIGAIVNMIVFRRLLKYQGQKAKFSDLFVGSIIGTVVQNITPKSIGGDLATFWFLRRRNIPRPVLLSSIVVNTFVWQISNIVLVICFVPIGMYFYKDFLLDFSNPNTVTFVIFLILGLVFDTLFAAIFLILALSIKIQRWFLKWFISFLEWLPFINLYDPESKKNKYEYEFFQIKDGVKKSFKNAWRFLEILFYKLVTWFIAPMAIFMKVSNVLHEPLQGGWYFNIIVSSMIIRSANSISITPGGIGTNEYFLKLIYNKILIDNSLGGNPNLPKLRSDQLSSLLTAINSFGSVLLPTIISALFLSIVFIGEKRVDKYAIREKNIKLMQATAYTTIRTKTRYYKITWSVTFSLLAIISLLFILI